MFQIPFDVNGTPDSAVLAEHALFGPNGFDASLGSVVVCINNRMPMDACFFNPPLLFPPVSGVLSAITDQLMPASI